MVSDVQRAANWYRDQAGLTETARRVEPSLNNAGVIEMARGSAGVSLIESSIAPSASLPQIVCLVLDGPPAPPAGSKALYLIDPDGTAVELPPLAFQQTPE
jgi:hypothetical protein